MISAHPSALEHHVLSSSTHQGKSSQCRSDLSFLRDHLSGCLQRMGTDSAGLVIPQTACEGLTIQTANKMYGNVVCH